MSKIIFSEDVYTVARRELIVLGKAYTEWKISDGVASFSLGYEPTLTLEGVKDEIRKYKLEKEDDEQANSG